MSAENIYSQLSALPGSLKNEVADFIEFLSQKHKNSGELKERKFGCLKGQIIMSPNFDEPLENFKDYM